MTDNFKNIIDFVDDLQIKLKNPLPAVSAHKKMVPVFQSDAPEYFSTSQKLRAAAVLIIIFEEDEVLKTVFIERMPDPGPHSSQIAFPGGKAEESDKDLIDTALREALEETGVNARRENVVGILTPVQIPISGYSVLPVVCFVDEIPQFVRCEIEVKSIFTVELFQLLETESVQKVFARGVEIEAPCFVYQDKVIWGATAMVLRELKELMARI